MARVFVATASRREFLRFLCASALLVRTGAAGSFAAALAAHAQRAPDDAVLTGALAFDDVIKSVDEALNVFDFERALRTRASMRTKHMFDGVDLSSMQMGIADISRSSLQR